MRYTLEMFEHVSEDASSEEIKNTGRDLEKINYEPLLIMDAVNFIYWKKEDMIKEYHRLMSLEEGDEAISHLDDMDPEEAVEQQLGMLLYHYEILSELRKGDAEAWDLVHELYEDD